MLRTALSLTLCCLALLASGCTEARAQPPGAALVVAEALPAAGAWRGAVDFDIVCDTDIEAIAPTTTESAAGTLAVTCFVEGTTAVFFGGVTTVASGVSVDICEGGACFNGSLPATYQMPLAARGVFGCRVAAGTVTIKCNGVTP